MAPLCQNWLVRGAQSAIFYYVSCGPCLLADHQRRRKRDAEVSRRKNARIKDQNPDAYTHPPAFGLNSYWQEEVELGTGLPNIERSQLQSGRQMKYRRPDEEIIIVEELDNEGDGRNQWVRGSPKAPEINELHPPVLSFIPAREDDRRWMKLPPPSTAFLEGKSGVSIVRRIPSKRSRYTAEDEVSVSRQERGSMSVSDEDADDEIDEEDNESDADFPSRPRAVYRADIKRISQRPGLPTVISVSSVPRVNTENISPRTSGHSAAGSAMSSNESLHSGTLHPQHHAILLARSNSAHMGLGTSPMSLPIKASRIDSQQDQIAELTLSMEVDEHLAKEHIWLGARDSRPSVGSKRWSTEF